MSDHILPLGWVEARLGDLITLEYGKGLPRKRRGAGPVPVFGSNGIVGHHSHPLIQDPCVIVGRKGAVGSVHLSETPSWPIDTTYYAIPPEGLHLKFLYHLLWNLNLKLLDKSTAIPGLNRDDAYAIRIEIPPVQEQARIAEKIEELLTDLDDGLVRLRKAHVQLRQFRESVLKSAFEGKLTGNWREQHVNDLEAASALLGRLNQEVRKRIKVKRKDINPPDISNLHRLPNAWAWARIGQVVDIIDYRGRTPPFSSVGIPHLRSSNVKKGRIVWEDLRFVTEATYKKYMTRGLPEKGDLLFTTEAPLGEVALAPEEKFSVAQRVMLLRPMNPGLLPKFLLYQLMSEGFQARLKGKGTGTTVTGISSTNFQPLEVIVAPLAEQYQIVNEIERRFSVADVVGNDVTEGIKRAAVLRQSILKYAFEGKLVRQIPSDEPASVLLERVRSLRSANVGRRAMERKISQIQMQRR